MEQGERGGAAGGPEVANPRKIRQPQAWSNPRLPSPSFDRSPLLSPILLLLAGLLLVTLGAEWLVRGASRFAAALGLSRLMVGLTVVAVGTSLPEVVVTVRAALAGQPGIGLGNVIGSNIFNVLLVLGLTALLGPIVVSRRIIRIEVPILIGLSGFVWFLALDGWVGPVDGALLLAIAVGYTWFVIRKAQRSSKARGTPEEGGGSPGREVAAHLALALGGLVLLAFGARWLVDGASGLAQRMGVSDLIIGLTLVAGGTSLPELAASLVAALRGERDMAVGNIMGSNIYNLAIVLGAGSLLSPGGLPVAPGALSFDLPIMTAVAVACLPIFFSEARIDRWEGAMFLAYYLGYVAFLFLQATDHATVPVVGWVMVVFIAPLTLVTLAVVGAREWRSRRTSRSGS
jgi:cation:H+ antiporter